MKHARILHDNTVLTVTEAPAGPNGDAGGVLLSDGTVLAESEAHWLPPVRPGTIFAIGLNYMDHAKELSFEKPKEPMVFFKGPNTLTGHRQTTFRPEGLDFMHYECELAVVIGKTARNVPREKALEYVAGYTVANDYAFRGFLRNYYRPNLKVKSRDRALPMGPWLVDAADIPDPMNLRLRTFVNGKLTQDGNTRDMIFDVSHLIAYFSGILTLRPGDTILTGTPDGIVNVQPGDEVVTEIESVGRLVNTITADDDPSFIPYEYR